MLFVFKKSKLMCEKQSGKVIKVIRTDVELNILHMTFKNNCDEGMLHEVPTPYTPQHNGVAERRNRTIMNMVRSMLKGRKLPKYFWGEAVSTTSFILNRSSTRSFPEITLEEA